MSLEPLLFECGLSALSGDAWLEHLEDVATELGLFEPLGPDHQAAHLRAGSTLLVCFEQMEDICNTHCREPRSFDFARDKGWSVLSVIANDESWYRHPAIYQFFDGLTDDGFFDDYDRVLFHGTGGGGYAAAAYSVAAPGSRVLALRPQATLAPGIAGWDQRYTAQRRHDFARRYGYAPDMIEAAAAVYLLFNPYQRLDAMHAALFRAANVIRLRAPGLPGRIDSSLDAMKIHTRLIEAAMEGTLDPVSFARIMAVQKHYPPYQRNLYKRAVDAGHDQLAAQVAAHVVAQIYDKYFEERLEELADAGVRPRAQRVLDAAQ